MSNRLGSVIKRGLKHLEANLPTCYFIFNNEHYQCIRSTIRRGDEVMEGGRVRRIECTLIVRTAVLPTGLTVDSTLVTIDSTDWTVDHDVSTVRPSVGKKSDMKGRTYRVIQIREPATETHWEIDVEDAEVS